MESRSSVYYTLNLAHPVISALRASVPTSLLSDLDSSLRAISDSLPVDSIYHDGANDKALHSVPETDDTLEAYLEDLARQILDAVSDNHVQRNHMLSRLTSVEPFAFHHELTQRIQERLAST
jgi:hypothetical protein